MSELAEAKWYVVHTYSGYENKVKNNIMQTVQNRHFEDYILEVRVPMESVVEIKNGGSKTTEKKMFPGYVLVHMIQNDDTWYIVRNTRGVTGFVGPGSDPVALTDEEIEKLGLMSNNLTVESIYNEGDVVKVITGAWEGTVGTVKSVNNAKGTVTVTVDKLTVTFSFSDVRHLD